MTPTLRRTTSILGLAALVAGVPAVLMAAVGWPLPRGLPTPGEVAGALGDGWRPGGRFVLGVLALVGWALWAQVMRHVVAEARRLRLAGDEPPPVPAGAGMSARLAAWLVGGLVLAAHMAPAVAAAPALPAVLSAARVFEHATPETPAPPVADPVQAVVEASPSYVVHTWAERQDCLWTIAERYLGDPFRWRELVALNADVRQPGGRRLADDPRHWVYPGMQLRLPPDATGLDVVPPTEPAAPPVLAEPAAPTPLPEAALTGRAAAPVATPTTVAAAERSAPTPPAPGRREPRTTDRGGSAEGSGGPIRLGRGAMLVAQALALGLPVFAAGGLVLRLNRRRRSQVARARPGRDIVRPEPGAEELERRARAIAADEAAEWVDAAVRVLTAGLADAALPAPAITCVRAGELGLEVLLAEPCDVAPPGFSVVDDGAVWRLDPDLDLAGLRSEAEKHPALTPALVSIGASPEGPLLVDLEALGVLSVEGAPDRVQAFLAGVALELASAPWAEGVDVRLLDPEPRLAALEGVELAGDPAALAAEVAAIASSTAEAVGAERTTLAARLDPGGEAWFPTVVVARAGTAAADVDALAAATCVGAGVALVAPGPVSGARWRLVIVDGGRARLEPLELVVHAAGAPPKVDLGALDPAVIEAAAGLLEAAARDEDVAPAADLAEPVPVPERIARREDHQLWVGVLGSVEVSGWAKAVGLRRKYEEIVAYLATHDGPVGGERLRAAVWPDKEIDPKSFREAMS
ncbi:MAG: hypothetical protein ACLGIO_06585, partial [Acidimicrobiia bacterium]